jgi:hypothetical protein
MVVNHLKIIAYFLFVPESFRRTFAGVFKVPGRRGTRAAKLGIMKPTMPDSGKIGGGTGLNSA